MHVANQRKLEYYMELHNREGSRLEVKMRIHQGKKERSYEKESEELKKCYNIREDLKRIEAKEGGGARRRDETQQYESICE